MPSTSKTGAKRKADEVVQRGSASQKLDVPSHLRSGESDQEDEAPAPQRELTPEEMAMAASAAALDVPSADVSYSSGGGNAASAEGVVLKSSKIMIDGHSGKVPKIQLVVALTKVNNIGSKDVITTPDGPTFGLPSKRLPAAPDEIAKKPNAKGPQVLDVVDHAGRANLLNTISASFYIDAPKEKDDGKAGAEACVPGMLISLSGISCEVGRNGTLYCNVKRAKPIGDAPAAGQVAKKIIASATTPSAMAYSAVMLSMNFGGFFEAGDKLNAWQQQQAQVIKNKWECIVQTASSKLEATALSLGKDASASATVDALNAQADTIKKIQAEDAACGLALFDAALPDGCTTAYTANIVQTKCNPVPRSELRYPGMVRSLYDPTVRDSLPPSFAEGKVVDVTTKGNLLQIGFRIHIIANTLAAVAAIRERADPVLKSLKAAASVKLSCKFVGQELFGTTLLKHIEMAAKELIPFSDMALNARVFPRSMEDLTVDGHFVSSSGIDLISGITNAGVQVSESWLDQKMLRGRGVYIYSKPTDGEFVEVHKDADPLPVLAKNGYACINQAAFDFDGLRAPVGTVREYYVVYSGASSNVAQTPGISTSVEEGESHLETISAAARDDGDLQAFLKDECLIYVVAATPK